MAAEANNNAYTSQKADKKKKNIYIIKDGTISRESTGRYF